MSSYASARRVSETRLRYGTHEDLAAISRLIHRANQAERSPHIDEHELESITARGQLLVLPLDDTEIAAAACLAPGRGLVFLVLDPDVATPELEHRMIDVADALSESEWRVAGARGRR